MFKVKCLNSLLRVCNTTTNITAISNDGMIPAIDIYMSTINVCVNTSSMSLSTQRYCTELLITETLRLLECEGNQQVSPTQVSVITIFSID